MDAAPFRRLPVPDIDHPADAYIALCEAGLEVYVKGGELKLRGQFTDDLLALARAHKPALLALLAQPHMAKALERQAEAMDFFLDIIGEAPGPQTGGLTLIPTSTGWMPSLHTKRLLGLSG
jgi:hypothetical protein